MRLRRPHALAVCLLLAAACAQRTQTVTAVVHQPAPAPVASGTAATAFKLPPVVPPGTTFVARSLSPTLDVWHTPATGSGPAFGFPTRNPVGQTLLFLVAGGMRDADGDPWLKIFLPIRPNEASGWVRKADVRLVPTNERIVVDLSERSLFSYRNGRVVAHYSVGIGRPETPTAVGTFYVWARVPQANSFGPYGVFALGLSGFSPVLKDWPGGGRMAIHGTSNPADRGGMVSHGCVRVYNADMVHLEGVPIGTPVTIKR